MALPDIDTVLSWRGRTIVDRNGDKIGKFDEIYLDTRTDRPEWAAVKTGLLGRNRALVPLVGAQEAGDDLRVPHDKASVDSAPDLDLDAGELSQEQEAQLYRHYGIDYSDEPSDTVVPSTGARPGAPAEGDEADAPTPGTRADDSAAGMTRSEEEVEVGLEQRPRERVRLKKYIVTDQVTKTVPVQREEVRLERTPADGEQAAATDPQHGATDEPREPR